MKVVLQEKIAKLGNIGDQVVVKPGFGRNYLIPYGKALPATAEHIAEFETRRAELEKKSDEVLAEAHKRKDTLADKVFTVSARASDEGKLFGSVGAREIAETIVASGIPIEKKEIDLPEGPIRTTGEYKINLQLHSDVLIAITIKVVPEKA